MKLRLTIFFLFVISNQALSQLSSSDIEILNDMLNEITTKSEYVLVSNPSKDYWKPINDKLKSKQFIAWKPKEKQCIVMLTRKDRRRLKDQIIKYSSFVWTDSIFNNSTVINADSMWAFLKHKNSEHSKILYDAAVKKNSVFIKNNKYWYYWAINFTRPIYFENNTACIASFYAFCGISAGWYQTAIYRKNDQGWFKCLTLAQGDY